MFSISGRHTVHKDPKMGHVILSKVYNLHKVIMSELVWSNTSCYVTQDYLSNQAASHAFSTISRLSVLNSFSQESVSIKICKLEVFQYRIQLSAPLTTTPVGNLHSEHYREGFVLTLYLEDGSTGIGEVAPLGNHKENMLDVKEQLQFLTHVIEGAPVYSHLPLLKGSFSYWISTNLGIPPDSLLPSVRCGMEMAILNAIAAAEGSTMLNLLHPYAPKEECFTKALNVKICALLDSDGTPEEVAYLATTLVEEGFTAIKLKVARRSNPIEDAIVIQEIRKKIGFQVQLRADANRKWTFDQALQFGSNVKDCALQYIEVSPVVTNKQTSPVSPTRSDVRSKAFQAVEQFLQIVKQYHEKTYAGDGTEATNSGNTSLPGNASILGWAMSSLTLKGKPSEQAAHAPPKSTSPLVSAVSNASSELQTKGTSEKDSSVKLAKNYVAA